MLTRNLIRISALSIVVISLIGCKPFEEVILHGDIKGNVTDAETSEPIQDASIKLMQSDVIYQVTSTGIDGTYLLKNITPGDYDIKASKFAYNTSSKPIEVEAAETKEINFALPGSPVPSFSDTLLDFGLDSTTLSFTISNIGKGTYSYLIIASQDWITVNPSSGYIKDEINSFTVTIDRKGLTDSIYKEIIKIVSDVGTDTLRVYLNGVMDFERNYYKVVKIGNQIWMAENLHTGRHLLGTYLDINCTQTDNEIIEGYCSGCFEPVCFRLGSLYTWGETMQYNPSDNGTIGTTQGICPVGLHLPTNNEWITLINCLGGTEIAGGKLKKTGTTPDQFYTYWESPNPASNESGFTALPAGKWEDVDALHRQGANFFDQNYFGYFWSSTEYNLNTGYAYYYRLNYNDTRININEYYDKLAGMSVRCVKNP